MNRSYSYLLLSTLCMLLLPCCIKSKEHKKAKKVDCVHTATTLPQDTTNTTLSADIALNPAKNLPFLSELPEPSKATNTTQTKPIRITNGISKKDIGYYKMFSWHYPSEFVLKVDGKPIDQGKSIETYNRTITITYDYVWHAPWGKTVGAKQVSFEIPQELEMITVNFANWDNEERISIPGAKKISKEELIKT